MAMNRRRWLGLGLGGLLVVGGLGGGLNWLRPGLERGLRLNADSRRVMGAVGLAVLDGAWPAEPVAREAALARQLEALDQTLAGFNQPVRDEISQLMSLLASPLGRVGLVGLRKDWHEASVAELNAALLGLRDSGLALKRQVFHALRDLHNGVFFADPANWHWMGYPGPRSID